MKVQRVQCANAQYAHVYRQVHTTIIRGVVIKTSAQIMYLDGHPVPAEASHGFKVPRPQSQVDYTQTVYLGQQ